MPEIELTSGEIIKASHVDMDANERFIGVFYYPEHDGYIPQNESEYEEAFMHYNKDEVKKILYGVEER